MLKLRILRQLAVGALVAFSAAVMIAQVSGGGQPSSTTLKSWDVAEVSLQLQDAPADASARGQLEREIRRAFRIYPGSRVDQFALTLALHRVTSLPEVLSAQYRFEFPSGNLSEEAIRLIVEAKIGVAGQAREQAGGMLKSRSRQDFPILYRDPRTLVKLNFSAVGYTAAVANTWLGNPQTLGAGFPLAQDLPGTSAIADVEGSVGVGAAVAREIVGGNTPVYVYGNANYLSVGTAGRDIYSNQTRFSTSLEQIYAGVVGAGNTQAGSRWGYNFSYGRQTPCIGTGLLFCGVSGNGGPRGGMNMWARTGGRQMALGQFRWNNLVVENYFIQSNEVEPILYSNTRSYVFNLQQSHGYGFSWGGTYVKVLQSTFPYVQPDFQLLSRKGLNVFNPRIAWTPAPGKSGPVGNAEGGLETNSNFPMRAYAIGLEGGWSFSTSRWAPLIAYKYSRYSGDDPTTKRFERWDPMYGGRDYESWMPGMVMRYVQFNANLYSSRLQARFIPARGWRCVALWSYFRAIQSINYPYSISHFNDKALGNEFVTYTERSVGSVWYVRASFASYWPGQGVKEALPLPVAAPWVTFQAQVRYTR